MKGIITTQRLKEHCKSQLYFKEKNELDSLDDYKHFNVYMPRLQAAVYIAALLVEEEELIVKKLFYYTELKVIDLAILDSYITICQGKPVEAIDRLTSKEIDFYLRDDSKRASFDFYSQELFDILAIGEELKKVAFGHNIITQPHLDVERFGVFIELSYSEQLEIIEDILGEYFFVNHPMLAGCLTCDEIEKKTLVFLMDKSIEENLEKELQELFTYHLQFKPVILIKR